MIEWVERAGIGALVLILVTLGAIGYTVLRVWQWVLDPPGDPLPRPPKLR